MNGHSQPHAFDADAALAGWRRYLDLNASFERPFIFHLSRRGFFSEVNVLMDAIVFGLVERRRLAVRQARFNDLRWNDYFVSPLPNPRRQDWDEVGPESHVRDKTDPFHALLSWARDRPVDTIDLPELGLKGSLTAVKRPLSRMMCCPTPEIVRLAEDYMSANGMSEGGFSAIHIRRGDKVERRLKNGRLWSEGEDTPISHYADALARFAPTLSDVFVMTDDYGAVEALEAHAPSLRVLSTCPADARGYDQLDFNLSSIDARRTRVQRLLMETQIALRSGFFAGGFKSNVARYLAIAHPRPDRCVSVDSQKVV